MLTIPSGNNSFDLRVDLLTGKSQIRTVSSSEQVAKCSTRRAVADRSPAGAQRPRSVSSDVDETDLEDIEVMDPPHTARL